jgi:hypothetical protein
MMSFDTSFIGERPRMRGVNYRAVVVYTLLQGSIDRNFPFTEHEIRRRYSYL